MSTYAPAVTVSNLSHTVTGSPQDTINLTWSNPAWPFNQCGSYAVTRRFRIETRKSGAGWVLHLDTTVSSSGSQYTNYSISGLASGEYEVALMIQDTYNVLESDLSTCTLKSTAYVYSRIYGVGVNYTDTTPDQFDFGTGNQYAGLNTWVQSQTITLTGITGATIVNGVTNLQWRRNGGAWRTSGDTVYPGDIIQVQIQAASSYLTTASGTLTIGGVSDTFSCKTKPDPGNTIVYAFTSLPINLGSHFGDFYGPYGGPYPLTAYCRGAGLVPDIAYNSHVPTTPPIKISDLLGTALEFYALSEIQDKTAIHMYDSTEGETANSGGSGNKQVQWLYGTDYLLADGARGQAEFQVSGWGIDSQESSLDITVSLATNSTALAPNWTRAIPDVRLIFDHNDDYSNGTATGWLEFKIRSKYDPARLITMRAEWVFVAIDLNGLNS